MLTWEWRRPKLNANTTTQTNAFASSCSTMGMTNNLPKNIRFVVHLKQSRRWFYRITAYLKSNTVWSEAIKHMHTPLALIEKLNLLFAPSIPNQNVLFHCVSFLQTLLNDVWRENCIHLNSVNDCVFGLRSRCSRLFSLSRRIGEKCKWYLFVRSWCEK